MKELNEIVLGKGLFTSIKGQLCLTTGHLDYREGQMEVTPLSEVVFDTFDSNESLCPLFFIKFLFFHQMIALQKL